MAQTYDEAVSAWAGHLRAGGTTTWDAWRSRAPGPAEPLGSTLRPLPDAVHLELVRRINLASSVAHDPGRLADVVLTTPAPGRGRVDVPLPWTDTRTYGDPPIEPDAVPDDELLRVAVGVLTRLLPGVPPPPAPHDLARWPMPWRRRFRLYGSPGTVDAARGQLLAQGLVESDWRPVHVVIGRPVEVMMAEHWAASSARGARIPWSGLWRRSESRDALPRGLDVVATAERLAATGTGPVHLVLGREPDEVGAAVAALLRSAPLELPGPPDPALADLLQRVNLLAALHHGPQHVRRLAATLADTMSAPPAGSPSATVVAPPAPPPGARDWATDWAQRRIEAVTAHTGTAGYIVHGDPRALAPHEPAPPASTDRRPTLDLAVEACLRTWSLQEENP